MIKEKYFQFGAIGGVVAFCLNLLIEFSNYIFQLKTIVFFVNVTHRGRLRINSSIVFCCFKNQANKTKPKRKNIMFLFLKGWRRLRGSLQL